jgi:hypothetical protein
MTEFLATTFSYPTVVFTVLLAVCCAYWLMVIVGALGVDALDFDFDGVDGAADGAAEGIVEGAAEGVVEGAAEGVVEGAAEGIVEGAAEGVVEGAAEGVVEGAAEGVAEGAAEGATEGAAKAAAEGVVEGASFLGTLFLTLKLRNVPMTLVLSVWLLFSWTITSLLQASVLSKITFLPPWLGGTAVALGALVVSLPVTSVFVRPLGRILKVEKPTSKNAIIGQVVKIDTSRVDDSFGSAKAEDGGAGLIIRVRCEGENNLTRGSKALVVSYDAKRDAYEVAPIGDILPSEAGRK